jgi:hypothetical protein
VYCWAPSSYASPANSLPLPLLHKFLVLIWLLICFPFTAQKSRNVTHACALHRQEVLLLRLYCSTLNIPVQALLLGHALTITPSIKCAPMIINLPASTPLIALWSSGVNSGVATSLGTLLLEPRCSILKNQCHYCLMHVWP